jgi:tol-pal system protein YbgF
MKAVAVLGCVGVVLFAVGCARKPAQAPANNLEDRHFEEQYESLTGVENDGDRWAQRLRESGDVAEDHPSPPANTPAMTRDPRTIHLSDEGDGDGPPADEVDETGPRPSIKLSGSGAGRGRRGLQIDGSAYEDESTGLDTSDYTTPPPATGRPSALDPNAKHAYDQAIALVNKKAYGEALEKFASFLVKYPDHPYAENALYWRGECYVAQGEYARAIEQFESVLARFPSGNKAADALLKLGLTEQKVGDADKAKAAFERLERDYPRSEAARKIPSGATPGAHTQGKP